MHWGLVSTGQSWLDRCLIAVGMALNGEQEKEEFMPVFINLYGCLCSGTLNKQP